MKKCFALLLAAVLLLVCCVPAAAAEVLPEDVPQLRLAAHRGYSAAAPENTLAAFCAAGEAGYFACECDIYPTADGKWVVLHDATIDRTTNGSGRATDQTYDALSSYRVDGGENLAAYPDEHLPELGEYLAVCNAYGMASVIEVKGGGSAEMEDLAARLTAEADVSRVYLVATDKDNLCTLNRLLPDANVFLLTYFTLPGDIAFCKDNGLDGIDFCCPLTPAITAAAIRHADLRCAVWTVNAAVTAKYLSLYGVEFVTTNGLASPLTGFWRTVVNTWNVIVGLVYDLLAR